MLIIVIVSGMIVGWGIGNYLLDKWINRGNDEVNKPNPK